ncbi:helix-turn-helix transcriptional regulator [Aerococcaceae bacterium WGS1372]
MRKKLLFSIRDADELKTKEYFKDAKIYLDNTDPIDILKRIEGNELRSHKNLTLSHNSMYALMAELGGLDPVLSHYFSEKYAILIENSQTIHEIDQLHTEMIERYSSPSYRFNQLNGVSLSTKVTQYITNNFMNELNIQTIADKFFVTKEHLMRTFKKETNQTINDVIRSHRLKEAEELLARSSLFVTDISMMVGYNSVQYFSTVFKEAYGVSPTKYQKDKHEE